MSSGQEVYFQFKGNPRIDIGKPVYLKDIIYISCPDELRFGMENIELLPQALESSYTIRAVDIIQLIRDNMGDITVNLLGKENILIEPKDREEKPNGMKTFFTVLFTAILLFIGAGLAIMYFHEDVNMHKAHKTIYEMITGVKDDKPLIISIPYSIGLGLGIAGFFDVFSLDKKDNKPGPLEIEIYKYNKDIEEYKISTGDNK